jgi:hypothetical protein
MLTFLLPPGPAPTRALRALLLLLILLASLTLTH